MRALRLGVIGLTAGLCPAQPLTETFDSVSGLAPGGWALINMSAPIGVTGWFQGNPLTFAAQGSSGYVAADYRNVLNLGTISNWLMTPERTIGNGDVLEFWTRTVSPSFYADRLQVRLSVSGASTTVGPGATEVGDFSVLLLDINPNYEINGSGYPQEWTKFQVTVSGLPGPVQGRFAFRYFVEHGGEIGARADYIGIDTLTFTPGGTGEGRCCITATGQCTVQTSLSCASLGGVFAGVGTACTGFTCPQPPTGACCLSTGLCAVLAQDACTQVGGVFKGAGAACGASLCPIAFPFAGQPVGIPDGTGPSGCSVSVAAEIFVPLSFPIESVEAAFVIDHAWQGDLKVQLTKVGGPTVLMVDRPGYPQFEYGFSADDYGMPQQKPGRFFRVSAAGSSTYDAGSVAFPGVAQPGGVWLPENPLNAFAGLDSVGIWRLEVFDCAGGDFGQIQSFVLHLNPPAGPRPCYANCDDSTGNPLLSANDFQCFLNLYASGDFRANCDGSLTIPRLTANDFNCFLNQFASGCP